MDLAVFRLAFSYHPHKLNEPGNCSYKLIMGSTNSVESASISSSKMNMSQGARVHVQRSLRGKIPYKY